MPKPLQIQFTPREMQVVLHLMDLTLTAGNEDIEAVLGTDAKEIEAAWDAHEKLQSTLSAYKRAYPSKHEATP